jgi:hypothetical protein
MANVNFKIPYAGSATELLSVVKKTISKYNGTLDGNVNEGSFVMPVGIGNVEGNYTITNSEIAINITKKPLIVTGKMIEKQLRKHMDAAGG